MNTIRFWFNNARYRALPQSVLPAIVAVCMAWRISGFSWYLALFAVLGIVSGHLGMNLFDDYFDYKVKGPEFRDNMAKKGFRARIAKCPYLTSGQTDLKHLLLACCTFGAMALALGLVIWLHRGNFILYMAIVTALLGVSYSGAPLRLSYHGFGELLIGLMFGPMLMVGVYYSACGHFDWSVLFVSIPIGLLVTNIVYVHSIMDFEPDKEVGKMTFAVLLNNKKAMLFFALLLLLASFGCIIGGVLSGYLSPYYLLTLLTLPMACTLFYLMIEFIRNPQRKFSPRFWMGPMGDWKRIQEYNLDWFLIRWLLARNLLSMFCIIIVFVSLMTSGKF